MACCGIGLRSGGIVMGTVLLVLVTIRLGLFSTDMFRVCRYFFKYNISDLDIKFKIFLATAAITEVTQILTVFFVTLLFIGLIKNRRDFFDGALLPSGIVYLIENAVFIFIMYYFPNNFSTTESKIYFTLEIICKVLILCFLFLIKFYEEDIDELPSVTHAREKEDYTKDSFQHTNVIEGQNVHFPKDYVPFAAGSNVNKVELPESYYPAVYNTNGKEDTLLKSYLPVVPGKNKEPKTHYTLIV